MLDTPHCPYTSPTERSSLLVANGRINSISSSISSTDTNRSSPSLSALTSLSRGGHSRTHRKIRSWVWAWQWVSPRSRHRSQWVEDTPKPSRSTFPSDENLELVPATVGPLQLTEIKRRSLLGGIWLAQCLAGLNLTLVSTMIPTISSEFQQSHQGVWIGTAYLLSTTACVPLYGRMCNLVGRRKAGQSAILLAAIGVAICGIAGTQILERIRNGGYGNFLPGMTSGMGLFQMGGWEWLILGRFVCGLGCAGIFATSSIVTSDFYFTRGKRGYPQSISDLFYWLGLGLGGPFGGIITNTLDWRWAFLLQVPVFLLSYALVFFNLVYVVTLPEYCSTKEILSRADFAGSFLLSLSIGLFLVFLSTHYNEGYPITSSAVIIPLILSLFLGILFLLNEAYFTPDPIIPRSVFRQKIPVLIGCSNVLVAVCTVCVTYHFPTWFQVVRGESTSQAGFHLLQNSVCVSAGSLFAGWAIKPSGCYKRLNIGFGILPAISALFLAGLKGDSGWIQRWLPIIPLGFGNAILLQTTLIAFVSRFPESQTLAGTGIVQLLRGIGHIGGLGITSSLFQSRLDMELCHRLTGNGSEDLIRRLQRSVNMAQSLPEPLYGAVKEAYIASFRRVFTLAAFAAFGAYLSMIPVPDKILENERLGDMTDNARDVRSHDTHESADEENMSPFEEVRDEDGKIVTFATPKTQVPGPWQA